MLGAWPRERSSHEAPRRVRDAVRVPAADAYDHGAGHALHARLRYHRARPADHPTFGGDPSLSRPLRCSRIVAPAGAFRLAGDGIVRDSGLPDPVFPNAFQHAVEALPADTLVYLLGSRYCETDRLSDIAWKLFEQTPPGWARVQAICDFVHRHITFGHEHARATKTAGKPTTKARVCAVTMPISPSRSAAV